jgi:hypothetical protein
MFVYTYGTRIYCSVGHLLRNKCKGALVNTNIRVSIETWYFKENEIVVIKAEVKTFCPSY